MSKSDTDAAQHAPVALPAGAFEHSELVKAVGTAAKADDRDDAMSKALADINHKAFEDVHPAAKPDHEFREVTREDLGITETIQVYVPPEEGEAKTPPAKAGDTKGAEAPASSKD